MFNGLQTLLIGSTFKERKQMIDEMKNNLKQQNHLKSNFVNLELAKLAITDPDFIGGSYGSVREWEEELGKWKIIKDKEDIEDLSNRLDIALPNPLHIDDLPLEVKKILSGILHSKRLYDWAESKNIIRNLLDTNKNYEDLIAYHYLHGIITPTNTQKLVKEVSEVNANLNDNLSLKLDKQLEMLEKIESLLERLISKTEIINKLDKEQDPEL